MKRILIIAIAIIATMLATSPAMAQKAKFGHVDYAGIIKQLPETDAAQKEVEAMQADYESQLLAMQKELETKAAEFQEKQATYSTTVANLKRDELLGLQKKFQDFQQKAESDLMAKQQELLAPVKTKVLDAIKEVAKANAYTYIFDIDTPLYGQESDDITDKVKEKLGLK